MTLSTNEFKAGESVTVKITISNRSNRAGKETVMLYMRDMVASNSRPIQQMIAFEKVEIDAGETKVVEFTIEEPMLRFWNNKQQFVSESGLFEISTGYVNHLILTRSLELV